MQTYYVFSVNSYFNYIYKNKPYKVYKILEEMFYLNKKDIVLSYKLFEQIASPFNKTKINKYLKELYSNNSSYHYCENTHIICNNNEYTKLIVSNTSLKIKTNLQYPTIMQLIRQYGEFMFVCDFINKKYFWIEKSNILVA